MPKRLELIAVLLLLFMAAFVRIEDLGRLPAGFNDEEIGALRIAETVRTGAIGVFYRVEGQVYVGRESAFPLLETVAVALVGDGLFGYRVLPFLAGLLSVALVYALGRRLFGFVPGMVAGMLFAFGLYPVLLSRSVLPQALLLPVYLGAVLGLVRGLHMRNEIHPYTPNTVDFMLLAVCGVFACYLHFTGLMIVPAVIIFVAYARLTGQPISRRVRGYELFAFLMAVILGMPYILSALRVPELSGFGALWDQRPATFWVLFTNLFEIARSVLNLGALGFLGIGLLLLMAGLLLTGIVRAARRWQTPAYMLTLILFVAGLLPAVWTGRADFNLAILFGPGALLVAVGFVGAIEWLHATLDTARLQRLAWLAPLVGVVVALGLSMEFYQRWPADLGLNRQYHSYLGTLAVYLDRVDDNLPTLICVENLTGNAAQPVPDPNLMEMMLHRSGANLRFSVCETAVILANGGKPQRIAFNFDQNGQTPTALSAWLARLNKKPVEVIGARRSAIYEIDGEKELADAIGKVTLSFAAWPPELPNPNDTVRLPVRMGNYLSFQGYETDEARTYKPGDTMAITTYWRVDGPQADDLRLFTHLLLDPGSAPVAQNDVIDVEPTRLRARDIVIQTSAVQIPYPFPEGAYYLSVGAYHYRTQARIPFYDGGDTLRGDRLFIGTVTIKG